jgi:hypothetical protein
MMNQVPFCRQQHSGRVAPIGDRMPPAGDNAAVIRPNPDRFYSYHAFRLSAPDEPVDMLIDYPTTRRYDRPRMRALKDVTRWAIWRQRRVCEGVERYHSLGDFEGINACACKALKDITSWAISKHRRVCG